MVILKLQTVIHNIKVRKKLLNVICYKKKGEENTTSNLSISLGYVETKNSKSQGLTIEVSSHIYTGVRFELVTRLSRSKTQDKKQPLSKT